MAKQNRYAPRTPFKFSLHLSDHMADTLHLSAAEHGAFLRLLFSYWRNGPPKDDDRVLARIVGMTIDEWTEVRPHVEPFFEVLHGQWMHWRTDDELQLAYKAIEKASRAGRAAAKARWSKENSCTADGGNREADTVAMRSHCESQYQQKEEGHALSAEGRGKAQALARAKQVLADVGDDVRVAERELGLGGAA